MEEWFGGGRFGCGRGVWWKGRFGEGGVSVEGGLLMDGRGVSVEGMLWTESGCMVPIFCCVFI